VKGYEGKKSVVVNNDACIVCRACEVQCPTQAITVTE
jgi:NAD-dependent dihydropyrimidine dehydrogenase PreA subunit